MKQFLLGLSISSVILFSALGGAIADRLFVIKPLDYWLDRGIGGFRLPKNKENLVTEKILREESVVVDVVEKTAPSVVTIAAMAQQQMLVPDILGDPFGLLQPLATRTEEVQQDIGSGFVVEGGLIVTNRHVVSGEGRKYKVVDKENKEYEVEKIYRDPTNDLAILQVKDANLQPLELGDSGGLKVGQYVIAIGTALGEFRSTVTTGVISGLGRGIDAGDRVGGFTERLDGVIQTDAAINPGNSGGPLLNSAGQVVGVNVAVSGNGQNIGFALPINIIKDSLRNFNETGKFSRPLLGVRFQMVTQEAALLNEIPQGAYVREVLVGSPADKGGIKVGDIITEIDGRKVKDVGGGLASVVNQKKVGELVKLKVWRSGKEMEVSVTLAEQNGG